MISIIKRNGKLNIFFRKIEFDQIIDISFFAMLCVHFCVYGEDNYAYYTAFFLFVGASLIKVFMRMRFDGKINVPSVFWWYLAFALFAWALVLWSEYPGISVGSVVRFSQILAILFCMSQSYATKDGFNRCLKLICWAGGVCAFYIFIRTPVSEWLRGSLGQTATKSNVNVIGMIMVVCAIFSLYQAYYLAKRSYYILVFVETALIVFTSSRKSILTIVFALIMMACIRSIDYKIFFRMLVAVGVAIIILYLIMNVDELYRSVGRRFESMWNHLQNNEGDNSMYARNMFISYAKQYFLEKPIIGSGAATFSSKFGFDTGFYAYAHNNYYEILVGGGLVGFSIYYSFYAYLFIKLMNIGFKFGDLTAKAMLTMLVSIMICEYGIVLYYSIYALIFLCAAYLYVCVFDNAMSKKQSLPIRNNEERLNISQNVLREGI